MTLTHILIVDNEYPCPKYLLVLNSYLCSYANQRWIFNTQRAKYNKFMLGEFIEWHNTGYGPIQLMHCINGILTQCVC